MKISLLISLSLWLFSIHAFANQAQPLHADQKTEVRAQQLFTEFRCLVCQNQTLADSHAGLAEDLKQEIRNMIQQGMSDQEISDYLVTRYGDFVRYRPALQANTVILWLAPFLLLLIASIGLWLLLRKQQMQPDASLNQQEQAALHQLLERED